MLTKLELFQAFVAPAIFISAAGLFILSINTRLMGMVSRLRIFRREKHIAVQAGKRQESLALQSQIESIELRAGKIKQAFFYMLLGTIGVMITCLLLGLSLYEDQVIIVAVILFVLSVLSMSVAMMFYISEVSIALTSVHEEEKLYDLIDSVEPKEELHNG
jgi:ABC-type siderophore export system fused ATPase/permease subunit